MSRESLFDRQEARFTPRYIVLVYLTSAVISIAVFAGAWIFIAGL